MGWFESSLSNSSKRKGRLAWAAWRVMAVGLCSSAALMGCGSEKPQAGEEKPIEIEKGNLKLALTGMAPSGAVYRLRNAQFTITSVSGSYETTVSTEEDPDSTFIYLEVPSGEYYVYLQPGYAVEQVGGSSSSNGSGMGVTTPTTPGTEVASGNGLSNAGQWGGRAAPVVRAEVDGGTDVTEEATTDGEPTTTGAVDGGPSTSTGDGLTAELISENPAYAYVYAYGISEVVFSFVVNGSVVNTGSGALIIGANFYDDDTPSYNYCDGDDPYEPNDFYSPAYIPTDETIYAFSCLYEDDMYIFDAPVPEGEMFKIEVTFDPAMADIDIEYGTSDYYYLGGSYGVSGTETLLVVSNGGSYLLHVYDLGPYSAPYQITFDTDFSSSNSCCETSDGPGCNDPAVVSCLCAIDPVCCTGSFDEVCVQEGIAECSAQCEQPEPTSSCCEAAPEPGCLDEAVEACVCDIDPTCCTSTFDQNCANLAQGQCGASCGGE